MDVSRHFERSVDPPYRFVAVGGPGDEAVPVAFRERILIDTVHDGGAIPRRYRFDADGAPRVDPARLARRYVSERDWGANLVASKLAAALGLGGYYRVELARVLLDFNRFPGSTPPNAGHLDRLAINPPFARALPHGEKMALLEDVYDRVSSLMEAALVGKLLKIGVHSYDEHNPSRTKRPDVSLITQPAGYHRELRMPFGVFDPLYPDELAESTASRVLRDRISLDLERAGFRVAHNHPYLLPEGSCEVRSQVWYFFRYLRDRYQEEFPSTAQDPAHERVWAMLLNTNLRLQESEKLRGYLHRYRRFPGDELALLSAAQWAYEAVGGYLRSSTVVRDYRRSSERPSSLTLEVRKDLLCVFDPETGEPREPRPDAAEAIARVIAGAIRTFLEHDR